MLHEEPSMKGILGIVLITFGAYMLHLEKMEIFYPVKALLREKGSLLMLLVAFIYSITSNLGKICIKLTSPIFFASIYLPILTISYVPIMRLKNVSIWDSVKPKKGRFIIGISVAASFFFHTLALNSALVSYAISVKRTSILFAIIYGRAIFGEKDTLRKLFAGVLMVLGVGLLSF